jgi:hypothetical protein
MLCEIVRPTIWQPLHRKLIIANEIRDNRRLVEPLDLVRRLERRWAVRFFCTKRIALKGCINRMPRPAKRRYALGRPPTRTGNQWLAASRSRRSLERLHQRLRRERLCEIGEASGLKRSLANDGVVVSSHVDDWHRNVRRFETVP